MDGGVMDARWRSVGGDGDEDLLRIPVPTGCQNGVSDSESRFLMAAAQRKSIWGKRRPPDIKSSGGSGGAGKKTCGGKALKLYRKFSTATKNRLMSKKIAVHMEREMECWIVFLLEVPIFLPNV
jgi:hypothetical protein